jgi:sulfate transport system ATP-binding protein
MSIRIEGLTKRYGDHPVLSDVSLSVETGELFVLLGPSGSGKSTVLRVLAGLTPADAGRIELFGEDVTDRPARQRDIGFVFQNYALFRHMTVSENVEFALSVRGVRARARRERREELLRLVGLTGFGTRRPQQLSGGQQQRVAIARALAHRPKVLLLDEPFGALDARIRTELRRSLREIQAETGVTTIFVTHDQDEAFELGDRLAVLDQGRLLEVGSPAELYLRPASQFTATFLGGANVWVGEAREGAVHAGGLRLPLTSQATGPEPIGDRGARVQVLLRPEDLEVVAAPPAGAQAVGPAVVKEALFGGSSERLSLEMPPMPGVRVVAPPAPFGEERARLLVTRTQSESARYPLEVGQVVWVVPRRVHILPHGGLQIAAVGEPLAGAWASRLAAVARATLYTDRGTDPGAARWEDFDLVVTGLPEDGRRGHVAELFERGARCVLCLPRAAATKLPERVLVSVAVGEPGKNDLAFAARLLRHWKPRVTVLTVLPADGAGDEAEARRFLAAGVRTLATMAVDAEYRIGRGAPGQVIADLLRQSGFEMLVAGVPLGAREPQPSSFREGRFGLGRLVGELVERAAEASLLLVRDSS